MLLAAFLPLHLSAHLRDLNSTAHILYSRWLVLIIMPGALSAVDSRVRGGGRPMAAFNIQRTVFNVINAQSQSPVTVPRLRWPITSDSGETSSIKQRKLLTTRKLLAASASFFTQVYCDYLRRRSSSKVITTETP